MNNCIRIKFKHDRMFIMFSFACHSFLKYYSLSSAMYYANFNFRVLFSFISFHCSSTDNSNVYRVYCNAYIYYTEITLNGFTSIISISLSSNYTFRSSDMVQLYLSHVLRRYEILISITLCSTTWVCARMYVHSSFVKFAINRNMINVSALC